MFEKKSQASARFVSLKNHEQKLHERYPGQIDFIVNFRLKEIFINWKYF